MASKQGEGPPLHATVVFIGHHQSGKSTTAGHLIIKLGGLDRRALERLERDTSSRPASRYAWVLDRLRLERDRAMTCDLKLSRVLLGAAGQPLPQPQPGCAADSASAAAALALTLVDTPGHSDYLRNAIAGITQSDVAVLVVDSRPAVMEAPSSAGQTKDMALLALSLANFRALVVAVNHMDVAIEADVAEQRFADASAALTKLLKRKEAVTYVPVSGYAGDNLVEPSPRLAGWWRGPTLMEAIRTAVTTGAGAGAGTGAGGAGRRGASGTRATAPAAAADLPLRLPILTVFKVGGIGTVPVGRLASGRLSRGARPLLVPPPRGWQSAPAPIQPGSGRPSPETSTGPDAATAPASAPGSALSGAAVAIRSIESFHESLAAAEAGDFVGLAVKGLPKAALRRGCVVCDPNPAAGGSRSCGLAAEFTARIQVLRDPCSKREGHMRHMGVGYCLLVHVHTAQAPCRLASIKRLNTKGEVVEAEATHLKEGDIAEVLLVPLRPLLVEPFKDYPQLGRFAARASLSAGEQLNGAGGGKREVIVAIGRIEHVKHRTDAASAKPALPLCKKRAAPGTEKEYDAGSLLRGILADSGTSATTAAAQKPKPNPVSTPSTAPTPAAAAGVSPKSKASSPSPRSTTATDTTAITTTIPVNNADKASATSPSKKSQPSAPDAEPPTDSQPGPHPAQTLLEQHRGSGGVDSAAPTAAEGRNSADPQELSGDPATSAPGSAVEAPSGSAAAAEYALGGASADPILTPGGTNTADDTNTEAAGPASGSTGPEDLAPEGAAVPTPTTATGAAATTTIEAADWTSAAEAGAASAASGADSEPVDKDEGGAAGAPTGAEDASVETAEAAAGSADVGAFGGASAAAQGAQGAVPTAMAASAGTEASGASTGTDDEPPDASAIKGRAAGAPEGMAGPGGSGGDCTAPQGSGEQVRTGGEPEGSGAAAVETKEGADGAEPGDAAVTGAGAAAAAAGGEQTAHV